MLRSSLPATIEIVSEIDMDSGYILVDPTQIHQLCMNLCTNAFHAMEPRGGILRVTLQRVTLGSGNVDTPPALVAGSYVQLSVSDTGSGMAKETQEKIFDPYFTTKDIGVGTGMGLAIVHTIVSNYNGYIECNSVLGEGATFVISLPVMRDDTKKKREYGQDMDLRGDERILFVDDEEVLGELAKSMFKPFGYSVSTYSSADVACTVFMRQPDAFDLVVSDFTMPDMNGLMLAEKIREHRQDIPIILCTDNDRKVTGEMMRKADISEFALKPFKTKTLVTLVRKVLNKRGRQKIIADRV